MAELFKLKIESNGSDQKNCETPSPHRVVNKGGSFWY